MSGTEVIYRYRAASGLRAGDGQSELALATSGGTTQAGPAAYPRFFSGLLTDPATAAAGMLAVAAVARASYVTSGSVLRLLRDPVVTSNGDRLRFESFSGCCGVHARLDLLPLPSMARRRSAGPPTWTSTTRCGRRSRAQPPAGDYS